MNDESTLQMLKHYHQADDLEIYMDLDSKIFHFSYRGRVDGSNFYLPYQYAEAIYNQTNGQIKGIIGDFSGVEGFEEGSLRLACSQQLVDALLAKVSNIPIALIASNRIQAMFLHMASRASHTYRQTSIVKSMQDAIDYITTYTPSAPNSNNFNQLPSAV